ncbi:MAG: VOC family protein [Solirubrobacterales bacterium]
MSIQSTQSTASDTSAAPVLSETLSLGPVHIVVTDLERSIGFYETAIGLQLTSRDEGTAHLNTGAGTDDVLVLHERTDATRASRHAGLYHFALLFPTYNDLARAARRLAETRTPIQGASNHGISWAIYLPDPDGNGIELAADQPRENWGDLRDPKAIGPRPLDLTALLDAVAHEESSPHADRDTVVGHLHLHVGDVEEGLAFYRDLLGFEVQTLFEGAAFVSAGGYHHHLGFNTWRGEGVPPAPADAVGLDHWTVRIPAADIEALRERAEAAEVPVENLGGGGVQLRDPWGIAVVFEPAG